MPTDGDSQETAKQGSPRDHLTRSRRRAAPRATGRARPRDPTDYGLGGRREEEPGAGCGRYGVGLSAVGTLGGGALGPSVPGGTNGVGLGPGRTGGTNGSGTIPSGVIVGLKVLGILPPGRIGGAVALPPPVSVLVTGVETPPRVCVTPLIDAFFAS